MPIKRPLGVTLLLWMVLSLSAWGVVRLAASLRWWDVLSRFDSSLSPMYLFMTGAGWALAGCVLIWSALRRKRWAYPAIPAYCILWLIVYWIERGFFQSPGPNLIFVLIISLVFLAVTLLCALHKSTKNYFTRSEEYGQHN